MVFFIEFMFGLATEEAGRGWSLSDVHQSIYRAEFLIAMLGLEWLGGTGRALFDCKRVVIGVAAIRRPCPPPPKPPPPPGAGRTRPNTLRDLGISGRLFVGCTRRGSYSAKGRVSAF